MFVRDYMTPDPVVISPDDNFHQAMNALRVRAVRRLPVVENERLVGIVVEKDLLSNQPSPATTLSLYEIYSLLEILHVRQMMSHPVITVDGDCPLEEAARIMVEKKISCLPVMDGEHLVGIITETDVFKAFVEVLGGEQQGVRFTLRLPERVGELARLTRQIAEVGGNISAVTTTAVLPGGERIVMLKAQGTDQQAITQSLRQIAQVTILDVRTTQRVTPRLFG